MEGVDAEDVKALFRPKTYFLNANFEATSDVVYSTWDKLIADHGTEDDVTVVIVDSPNDKIVVNTTTHQIGDRWVFTAMTPRTYQATDTEDDPHIFEIVIDATGKTRVTIDGVHTKELSISNMDGANGRIFINNCFVTANINLYANWREDNLYPQAFIDNTYFRSMNVTGTISSATNCIGLNPGQVNVAQHVGTPSWDYMTTLILANCKDIQLYAEVGTGVQAYNGTVFRKRSTTDAVLAQGSAMVPTMIIMLDATVSSGGGSLGGVTLDNTYNALGGLRYNRPGSTITNIYATDEAEGFIALNVIDDTTFSFPIPTDPGSRTYLTGYNPQHYINTGIDTAIQALSARITALGG
jgi:hypothetical protein